MGWRLGGLLGRMVAVGTNENGFLQLPHRQFKQWRHAFLHSHLLVLHLEAVVKLQHSSSAREKLRQVVGGCLRGELGPAGGDMMVAG